MQGNILPIGKYKGQPVEVLQNDPSYKEWLTNQPWFRENHGQIYNVIINNFTAPTETPVHNKLQSRFLDEELLKRLTTYLLKDDLVAAFEIHNLVFESNGWDLTFNISEHLFCFPSANRNDCWQNLNYPRWDKEEWLESEGKWSRKRESASWTTYERAMGRGSRIWFYVELKPSLGDDYPSVLRQVKNFDRSHYLDHKVVVVVEEFSSSVVTLEQVVTIFGLSKIHLCLLSEFDKAP